VAIEAFEKFDPEVRWAGGFGCLVCNTNVSELGAKHGAQCIDLGVEDDFLGHFGLCYDCAVQVALRVDYMARSDAEEQLAEAAQLLSAAESLEAEAARTAAQARLDKDTVERLIGAVYQPPETAEDE
jgi:hypothetical protein